MSTVDVLTEIWADRRWRAVKAQNRLRASAAAAFEMSPVASLAPTKSDRDLYAAAQNFIHQTDLARAAREGLCRANETQ